MLKKPDRLKNLDGERIRLQPIKSSDVSVEYCSWLNDPEVVKYMETRFMKHTVESTRDYVKKANKNQNTIFFAIIRKDLDKFIGTIKLGDIYWQHGFGNLAIMIGDRNSWGKGFASDAIKLLSDYAFNDLKLHKLLAGTYEDNIGSIKAFVKASFVEEFRQKQQYLSGGKYVDRVVLTRFSDSQHV